jgi:prepilin-type N-terminal cleavage/methylation domain-containing protein
MKNKKLKTQNSKLKTQNYCFGFTLLEIIIVVVIIAVLAASAAPTLRNFYTQTVQQDSTRTIATVLRTAQNLAVIHRVQMQVEFDLEKNKYRIVPDPSLTEDMKVVPKFARTHDLPQGVRFIKAEFNTSEKEDPNSKIRTLNFYANGSSDGGKIEVYGTKLKEITNLEIKKTTGNVIVNTQPIKRNTIHNILQSTTANND